MKRYPAEWEPQRRVWLAWPHNVENWAHRPAVADFYAELIGIIRRFQPVALLLPPGGAELLPRALLADAPHPLALFSIPTNDIWIRDYGPLFVDCDGALRAVSFTFNAWGEKFPPWDADNRVPEETARALSIPLDVRAPIFEGGAIEIDGQGAGMTTLDCLVGPRRNPAVARDRVEREIRDALGLSSLLVLSRGLEGDHTDGHIDNVARFLSSDHIAVAREDDVRSPNHAVLMGVRAELSAWRPHGRSLTVSTLPLPPQRTLDGEVLPASYLNFIFVNGGVIVPMYRCPQDDEALAFFKQAFPERKIIGIDCTLVIEEGGSLHCLSKQEPLL